MSQLNPYVFWPPFLIIMGAALGSFLYPDIFLAGTTQLNDWLLHHFGWLFSLAALSFLGIVIWTYASPLGKLKIGGQEAKPILTKWRWFAITLCTTVAVGILFWGTAEPISHLHAPPKGLGLEPGSGEAATFALSTMFMHWTFIPYGIYTLASLMFAIGYYNLKQPFSLGTMLFPILGEKVHGNWGKVIDAICLFSLVAGMAASLGAGLLTIAGGLESVFGLTSGPGMLALIGLCIVVSFILSAASGLQKGIRILSDLNLRAFLLMTAFVFITGPTIFLLSFGVEGMGEFLQTFFQRALYTGAAADDPWAKSWTIFYWANWLAWTPVTALFLGRLSYGYTVREVIRFNLIYPALFSCVWMLVFSGTALHMDLNGADYPLQQVVNELGYENVIFAVFERLPLAGITSTLFLLVAFLSYVTAADSNTSAMSGLSSTGISPESPEPTLWIKIAWGAAVGIIAWVMVTFASIDGIKMASNIGGLPALFLLIAIAWGMVRLILNPERLNL
ncbi:MAG: BCCT family transporter [Bacteroidota bacterium]